MKKKTGVVVEGSIAEFMELIASGNCRGDIAQLGDIFPENFFCHHLKHRVPNKVAVVLTPRHTKHLVYSEHLVCQVDCNFACNDATSKELSELGFVSTIQAFKIRSDEKDVPQEERIENGKFFPSSQGLHL